MEISSCLSAAGPYTCARLEIKSLTSSASADYCIMKRLDLHGVPHAGVAVQVEDFLLRMALPAEIITGNSTHNQRVVAKTVRSLGLYSFHPHPNNLGSVVVTEGL
jgi:hypothetical protein